MTQEQLDEVMWKSTPDWQKDQLREERADMLLWAQQQEQLRLELTLLKICKEK